jgi:hypothetical protein
VLPTYFFLGKATAHACDSGLSVTWFCPPLILRSVAAGCAGFWFVDLSMTCGAGGELFEFWAACRLSFSATPFAASFSISRLPLPLSQRRTATRGDLRGVTSGGDWLGATCDGDRRRTTSGEARLAGGGAAPVVEFARELDLLSVYFVCCCPSSDLCGFASFHCLCMLSPLASWV